jgi:hypothetical protein
MLHLHPREYLIYTVAETWNHTNYISYITATKKFERGG